MIEYKSPIEPKAFQLEGILKAYAKPAFANLGALGSGKTKIIIDEFGMLCCNNVCNTLIWIAPAGCYKNFPGEIEKHFPKCLIANLWVFVWEKMHNKQQQRLLSAFMNPANGERIRVLVINIEAISTNKTLVSSLISFMKLQPTMLVVDESITIKGHESNRTNACINISEYAAFRRIATGLIASKKITDIYHQFEFLDPNILRCENWYSFRARYAVTKTVFLGYQIRVNKNGVTERVKKTTTQIVGYKNVEELNRRLEPYVHVIPKHALKLLPKTYQLRHVELHQEQKRIYEELKKRFYSQLEDGSYVSVQQAVTLIMRLQQIVCGYTKNQSNEIIPVSSYRLRDLIAFIEEQDEDDKIIIWSHFHFCIKDIVTELEKLYGKGSFAQFHGLNKTTRKEIDEPMFLNDPKCRFMVASQGAAGRGNTWNVARIAIYYCNNYSLDNRLQSEDRFWRLGQDMPVSVVDFVADGTVDEVILKVLRGNMDLNALITGDNIKEWVV